MLGGVASANCKSMCLKYSVINPQGAVVADGLNTQEVRGFLQSAYGLSLHSALSKKFKLDRYRYDRK
jgi:hypothetical protein